MGSSSSKIESQDNKKKQLAVGSTPSPTIVVTKEDNAAVTAKETIAVIAEETTTVVSVDETTVVVAAATAAAAEEETTINNDNNSNTTEEPTTGNNKTLTQAFEKAIGSAIDAGLFGEETPSSPEDSSQSASDADVETAADADADADASCHPPSMLGGDEKEKEEMEMDEQLSIKEESEVQLIQRESKEDEDEEPTIKEESEIQLIDEEDFQKDDEQEQQVKEEPEEEPRGIEEMIKDLSITGGLVELSIAGNQLKLDSAEDVSDICQKLQDNLTSIESIDLSGNTLGIEACRAISAILPSLVQLKSFNMSDCFTGRLKEVVHVCLELISGALLEMVNCCGGPFKAPLRVVDFSDNAFGPIGAEAVKPFLSVCSAGLEALLMNNQGLGPDGGNIIMEAILESSTVKGGDGRLCKIEMGRTRLENGSCEGISKVLEAFSSSLKEVSFPQNGIRPEGIAVLSKNGLSHCLTLESLNLQDNTFTLKGSLGLAAAFETMGSASFKNLNVGDCLLGQEGAMAILEVLSRTCPNICILDLQFNEIESQGVQRLSELLSSGKFSCLERLALNGNSFNPKLSDVTSLKALLEGNGGELDSLSDMDYDTDNESESDSQSQEEEEEEEEEEHKSENEL